MVMGVVVMMIWSIEGVMIRTNTRIWVAHGLRHNRHPTRWGHHGRHAHQTLHGYRWWLCHGDHHGRTLLMGGHQTRLSHAQRYLRHS